VKDVIAFGKAEAPKHSVCLITSNCCMQNFKPVFNNHQFQSWYMSRQEFSYC